MMSNIKISKTGHKYLSIIEKKYSEIDLMKLLDELYLECEHGDDEHRKWLKDKFDDFYKRKIQ